jgi:hypothetical protein
VAAGLAGGVQPCDPSMHEVPRINSRPTHVVWLRGGHALLQERRGALLRVLTQVCRGQILARPSTPAALRDRVIGAAADAAAFSEPPGVASSAMIPLDWFRLPQPDGSFSVAAGFVQSGVDEASNFPEFVDGEGEGTAAEAGIMRGTTAFTYAGDKSFRRGGADIRPPAPPAGAASALMGVPAYEFVPGSGRALGLKRALMDGPAVAFGSAAARWQAAAAAADEGLAAAAAQAERGAVRERILAELGKRGLDGRGDELQLLQRLEDALEAETTTAQDVQDRVSDSKRSRVRRAMQLEASLMAKRAAEREAAIAKGVEQERARRRWRRARGLITAEDAAAEDAEDTVREEMEEQQREGSLMAHEDELSRAVEAALRKAAERVAHGREVAAVLGELEGVVPAAAMARLAETLRGMAGTVLASMKLRDARGGVAPTAAGSEPANPAALAAPSGPGSVDISEERRRVIAAIAEPKRLRAARLAVLRTRAVVHAARMPGEELGYGLEPITTDTSAVVAGVRRLLAHVSELRLQRRNAARWLRRVAVRTRKLEGDARGHRAKLLTLE